MWWCGFFCGVAATLIAVTLVTWVVDESAEMENFDNTQGSKKMSKRTCEKCRWWNRHSGEATGDCQSQPPIHLGQWPSTDEVDFCSQWADKTITPKQHERRDLIRQFAVALVASGWNKPEVAWSMAAELADYEGQV